MIILHDIIKRQDGCAVCGFYPNDSADMEHVAVVATAIITLLRILLCYVFLAKFRFILFSIDWLLILNNDKSHFYFSRAWADKTNLNGHDEIFLCFQKLMNPTFSIIEKSLKRLLTSKHVMSQLVIIIFSALFSSLWLIRLESQGEGGEGFLTG